MALGFHFGTPAPGGDVSPCDSYKSLIIGPIGRVPIIGGDYICGAKSSTMVQAEKAFLDQFVLKRNGEPYV